MRYLNSAGSLCWVHHRAACWTCVRICAACNQAISNANFFPQPSPRRWSTCPAATVLCTDLVQCGQMYVYTRGVAASCWVAEWGASVVASSAPVDVCLASCIFWISLRTSARIASCRWQVSRWRKRAKRRFVRWARRHTRAKAVHALHTCVPFCVYFRLCCQAVKLCSWLAIAALGTLPTTLLFGGTFSAAAAVRVACFPCGRPKFGFWFRNATFETKLLHFTRQAHTEKTTLTLAMFLWKVFFRMPQLAHVALPRRADVCIMLCALAANVLLVIAFPLTCCKGCRWFTLCANGTCTLFKVLGQQRLPVDRIPAQVSKQKIPA